MVVLGETEIFTLSHLFTILMSCCWVLETIVIILGFGNLSLDIEFGNFLLILSLETFVLILSLETFLLILSMETFVLMLGFGNLSLDDGIWKP